MRLLVLGGTGWLGRTIAICAYDRGFDVTCLARGESGAAPQGVTFIRRDRDRSDAYDDVVDDHWNVVVDLSMQPGQVRSAAQALAHHSDFVVFVSSASVYADHSTPGADETAAVLPALGADVMESLETYGEAKVACEQHAVDAFGPNRSAVVRSGLIAGPGDSSGRTGYWPLRFARPASSDGRVIVPESPELSTQVVDVRDLARWVVQLGERRTCGIFNAMGETVPFPHHIEIAREVAQHAGEVVWVAPEWLLERRVSPWMGDRSLPLWLPLPEYAGFSTRNAGAARAAGLSTRPLAQTLADTLSWELAEGPDRVRRAGLSREEERALLDELSAS